MDNKKWVVILIGPPGSGKGTQADLLAEKFGLFHLETSKIIEEKIKQASLDDKILMREKKIWETGKLNTPELVLKWTSEKVEEIANRGKGIVFSGSPRTIYEAEGEMPFFEKLYGRENIKVINIDLSREESVNRNSNRRICKASRHPIPNFPEYKGIKTCPKDGSEIITRILDKPETIVVRYDEYLNRTTPILDYIGDRGYMILKIKGEQSIDNVHKDVINGIMNKES